MCVLIRIALLSVGATEALLYVFHTESDSHKIVLFGLHFAKNLILNLLVGMELRVLLTVVLLYVFHTEYYSHYIIIFGLLFAKNLIFNLQVGMTLRVH